MKKKKKKAKAVSSPIIKDIPILTDPKVIVPPYEDSGVRYQGYYKKQTSGNTYELKKQYPVTYWNRSINGAWVATNPFALGINSQSNFYLTRIEIIAQPATTANPLYIVIYDGLSAVGVQKIQLMIAPNAESVTMAGATVGGHYKQEFEFNPTLRFDNGFYVSLTNPGYFEILYIIIHGFLEDR